MESLSKVINIIVVDDDFAVRDSLCEYFIDEGLNVTSFETAEDALVYVKENECDLMIVDLRLPKMNGESLITEVFKIAPKTKFIIYTGAVKYELPLELKTCGLKNEFVLHKPVANIDVFRDMVRMIL